MSLIVLFADDLGGLRGMSDLLADLVMTRVKDDTPTSARARVIAILPLTNRVFSCFSASRAIRESIVGAIKNVAPGISELQAQKELDSFASSIMVIAIDTNAEDDMKQREFQAALSDQLAIARERRKRVHRLYSYKHAQAFFRLALDELASPTSSELSLLRACRSTLELPPTFPSHISEILLRLPNQRQVLRVGVPLLSSALVMNSCPPGMHCMCSL